MRENFVKLVLIIFCVSICFSSTAVAKEKTDVYTVEKGDTLWGIAKKYLGDGRKYHDIYELNKDIISKPSLIIPGMELVLSESVQESETDKKESSVISEEGRTIKTFYSRQDDYQEWLLELGTDYKIETIEKTQDYVVTASEDVLTVDENGIMHTVGVGLAWMNFMDKEGEKHSYSICVIEPGADCVWSSFNNRGWDVKVALPWNKDTNVKSAVSSDETKAIPVFKDGELWMRGIEAGICDFTIEYADGYVTTIRIDVIDLETDSHDIAYEKALEERKNNPNINYYPINKE